MLVLTSFWDHFLINSHTVPTLILALIFECIFNGKWSPNGSQISGGDPPQALVWRPENTPKRKLVQRLILLCILVVVWLPFGSFMAPFGSLLACFGYLAVIDSLFGKG